MKTFSAKAGEVNRDWYVVDASDKTLGRLASEIAHRLRGKHKPEYTPHVDTGDYIVVVNAEKIRVTGNKLKDKMYYRHTGYIGNLKSINLEKLLDKAPDHQRNHYELSRLGRAEDSAHVEQMQAVVEAKKLSPEKNIYINYALGKELEDLDATVNKFIEEKGVQKIISVSDAPTTDDTGATIGLIRVLAYE